jgi:hypothetical protein
VERHLYRHRRAGGTRGKAVRLSVRETSFPTLQQRDAALEVFRERGYRVKRPVLWPGELWPGEVLAADTPELCVRWRALDEDPAAPLWELLQRLHAEGAGRSIGRALTLLDQGVEARLVWRDLVQIEAYREVVSL